MLNQITPVILTRDEEANIGRTLAQLSWANEVIVIDSLSQDRTKEIATGFPNVRFIERTFDSLAMQSNAAVAAARTPWVLLLDADHFLPREFTRELGDLLPPDDVDAFIAPFRYAVRGRILRASLYPPRIVLFRRGHAEVWQDGHAHRVRVDRSVAKLSTAIIHDDRKTLRRFLERQRVYMRQEADKLHDTPWRQLHWSGRIRKLVILAPAAAFVHSLFVRGLILNGRSGLQYAIERAMAESILSVELLRRRPR